MQLSSILAARLGPFIPHFSLKKKPGRDKCDDITVDLNLDNCADRFDKEKTSNAPSVAFKYVLAGQGYADIWAHIWPFWLMDSLSKHYSALPLP